MKFHKKYLFITLLCGILLLVIAIPTKEPSVKENEQGTEIEIRLANVLKEMKGVGHVRVMITYQSMDEVEGIVVVAEGGDNAIVIRNITEVVQALFDVDSHKIKVIKGNQIEQEE